MFDSFALFRIELHGIIGHEHDSQFHWSPNEKHGLKKAAHHPMKERKIQINPSKQNCPLLSVGLKYTLRKKTQITFPDELGREQPTESTGSSKWK